MNLGVLIRRQRLDLKLTLREVSKKTGISHSQISWWETGKINIKEEKCLEILTKAFDYKYSEAKDLIAKFQIEEARKSLSPKGESTIFNFQPLDYSQENMVPVYASIGAGFTDPQNSEVIIDHYAVSKNIHYPRDQLLYVITEGDSMSPTIDNGDELLILKNGYDIVNGKVYAWNYEGLYTVKRYKKITDDIALLIADNPNHQDITITPNSNCECVGQIIRVQKVKF